MEDKLDREERIRLEALVQANATSHGLSVDAVVDKAARFESFLRNTKTNHQRVVEFHETYGVDVGRYAKLLREDRQALRISLIEEEVAEYKEAVENDNIVEIADALTDLLYVTYGAMVEHGLPADALFAEVHRSNMSKLGEDGKPIYREDGKVMKGPNFVLPDISKILLENNSSEG